MASRAAQIVTARARDRALSDHLVTHAQAISRRELEALGFDSPAVDRMVRGKRLVRVYRGVYHCGSVPHAGDTELRCALLLAGRAAALTGQIAAYAQEHLSFRPRLIDVAIEGDPGRLRRGNVRVRRLASLPESDVMLVRGLRCTTPERTLLEIAGSIGSARSNPRWEHDHRALRRALRQATVLDHGLPGRLERRLADRKGERGSRILRGLLGEHLADSLVLRSNFEADFFAWCAEIGLPPWETNVIVEGHERDVFWRNERVVVELDTYRYHGDHRAFEADRESGNHLVSLGYGALRITDTRFYGNRAAIHSELLGALGLA